MRESEEYIKDSTYWIQPEEGNVFQVIEPEDAEHAVKLAYKEGYLEARADILEELRKHDSQLGMVSAICRIKEMKINVQNI